MKNSLKRLARNRYRGGGLRLLLVCLAVMPILSIQAASQAPEVNSGDTPWYQGFQWQAAASGDIVEVYSSEVDGSPYIAVKAVTRINSDVKSVLRAFDSDVAEMNGCSPWRQMCKRSRILSEPSEEVSIRHLILDLPWPLSDRDMVMKSHLQTEAGWQRAIIDGITVSDQLPEQKYVRADSRIRYEMRRLDSGETELTFINHTNLNGGVPAGLFNSKVVTSTQEEILALKRFVESGE